MEEATGMSGGKKLTLVVFGAIAVALVIVTVGIALYYHTGTYRVDPTRVGAGRPLPAGDNWEFEAVGPLNQQTFQLFLEHFDINFNAVRNHDF
ncbi:hypothetical protein FWC63_01700 [Candidatus Saccharibacteria bacterium]|nr:hypothetical protein [Candidatus Saccharibacteria bacterium]